MGYDLANIDAMAGPQFIGVGGSLPMIFLLISIAICVLACVVGSKHELDAYKKVQK